MSIALAPHIPGIALTIAILLGAMAAIIGIWRQPVSGAVRAIAIAALLALLANPQLRETERTPLPDIAIVIVDKSASQSLDGRDAVSQEAAEQLDTKLASLENVEVIRTDVDGADQTRLIEGLRSALTDVPRAQLAGAFVISDGQIADNNEAQALALSAPVHFFSTGSPGEIDRTISLTNAPRYGLVRDSVKISFRVDDVSTDEKPLPGDRRAIVTLRVDGDEILQQPVPVGVEASFNAPLDRPGETVIELQAAPLEDELTERNNIAVLPITAIRDRLRVLLISGEPHPGERVWRNLLKSDPAVDLVHFTILRPIEKGDQTPIDELALIPFPQDELFIEKLPEFDLIIFDRYTYRNVLSNYHFDNIARYVEEGGAVLIAAGPEYFGPLSLAARKTLSFILPALPTGQARETVFRPDITEIGERHPVTSNLPETDYWGRWLRVMPVTKRTGETLMTGADDAPLLILDRVGDGRVGLLLSDHVWLWARGFDGGGPHAELLRRIAHWLMKEPELEEESLRLIGEGDSLRIERRTLSSELAEISVTTPTGETLLPDLTEKAPGVFQGEVTNAEPGIYRAVSENLFAVGAVGLAAAPEWRRVVSTREHLSALTDRTGGGEFKLRRGRTVSTPDVRRIRERSSAKSGADWAGLLRRDATRIESTRERAIAPPIFWLLAIAGALGAAWWLEGRGRRKAR
ncbi:MAG: hypothetical protein AAGB02_04925 [Pseudomonadota bacterium]